MAKWEIFITRSQEMSLIIEADTYEQALALYDNPDIITDDYQIGNGCEIRLDCIVPVTQ